MGILNVTPDSFSDGGDHFSQGQAIDAGLRMLDDGADLVDVGGESTRPGAVPVAEEEELRRIGPVVEALARRGAVVSIDTMKSAVARTALENGAVVVNDVSALTDPEMASTCRELGATVCLMHMQGTPGTMQVNPEYDDVVRQVKEFLSERIKVALTAGISPDRLWIDPGMGFGKNDFHNLSLLQRLPELVGLGFPVLLGVSRKGFIGRALAKGGSPLPVDQRLEGTLAIQVAAQIAGVKILRAHDVSASRRAIDMVAAIHGQRG
jgi:dihydropteroate synthase